jgi:YidC/Oxa1 family membrane protein insertase
VQAIWDAIREGMGSILAFFYAIVPNAGFAIIMLTVLVRLILFPLTAKQAKSMIAMQRAQPEIKKLQAKYKNDRQKLNEELMKFYKEHQINPLGGCLPLLAQTPVFIALYQTLREIQHFIPSGSAMYDAICGAGVDPSKCTKPVLDFFGMNLAQSASNAPKGFGNALPYYVLVGLVVISAFFQQRQTMRNQAAPNPQMQIIGKIMPVVFGFISINIPAGVVLYFLTSNLWQIGQQEVVYRTIGSPAGPPKGKAAEKGPKGGGGGDAIEAKSSEKAPPAKGESTGGVKGIFKSLSAGAGAGAAADDGPSENGKPSSSSGGSSAKAAAKPTGSTKGAGSKTTPPKGAPTASKKSASTGQSANARRKNNRKRKR